MTQKRCRGRKETWERISNILLYHRPTKPENREAILKHYVLYRKMILRKSQNTEKSSSVSICQMDMNLSNSMKKKRLCFGLLKKIHLVGKSKNHSNGPVLGFWTTSYNKGSAMLEGVSLPLLGSKY